MENVKEGFRIKPEYVEEAVEVLERVSKFTPEQIQIGLAFLNGVVYGQATGGYPINAEGR